MRRAYALSEEEFCRAEAELELAVSLGLIGQAGFDALEQRRLQKNEENRRKSGNTKKAVELLADKLTALGCPKVTVTDLARDDMAEAVEDAFRYGKLSGCNQKAGV